MHRADELERRRKRAERFSKPAAKVEFGLLSKGDSRLTQKAEQLEFFKDIRRAYRRYCDENGQVDGRELVQNVDPSSKAQSIEWIFMSLRKLREGLSPAPASTFKKDVLIFSIKSSILADRRDLYPPSLQQVLFDRELFDLLDCGEKRDIVQWHCLHISLSLNDVNQAMLIAATHNEQLTMRILRIWVLKNWLQWRHLVEMTSVYSRAIIRNAKGDDSIQQAAITAISKSYIQITVEGFEKLSALNLQSIMQSSQPGWKLEGSLIRFREVKKR